MDVIPASTQKHSPCGPRTDQFELVKFDVSAKISMNFPASLLSSDTNFCAQFTRVLGLFLASEKV